MTINVTKTVTESREVQLPAYFKKVNGNFTTYWHIYQEKENEMTDKFHYHTDRSYGGFNFKIYGVSVDNDAEQITEQEYKEAINILYINLTNLVAGNMEPSKTVTTEN